MPSLRVTSVVFSVCRFWLRFGEAIDCQPMICGVQGEGGGLSMVASTRSVDGVTLTIFRCGGTLACCLTWLSLIGRRRLSMGSYSRRRCFVRSCVYWLCEVYARGTLGLLHRSGGAGRASGRRSMAR